MTRHGNKIPGITKERVREQLADETDPKAIKRLTAAREYLEALSPEAIEDKYGWHHQTIYNWMTRFEERGFEAALYDDSRPDARPNSATNSSSNSPLYSMNYPKKPGTMIQQHGVQLLLIRL